MEQFGIGFLGWLTAAATRQAQPKRVAVDETGATINDEWSWLYAAIDIVTKLRLDVAVFGRYGIDPAASILHRLDEKYDLSDTVFLMDPFGYRTALARVGGERSGSTILTESSSKNGFTPSKCASAVSTIRGWAVG